MAILVDVYRLTADDVIFMASPIGHTTALIVGARLPVMYGMTAVWQEHWHAEAAVDSLPAKAVHLRCRPRHFYTGCATLPMPAVTALKP